MSAHWANVQQEAAKTTRVCAYDRAGLGWSEPGPEPRDARQVSGELHTLFANAQKALGQLGLAEVVARLGTPASAGEIRSRRGEVLVSISAAELKKKVGAPSAAVHRADLQALLAREAGGETLRLGADVKGFEQDESGQRKGRGIFTPASM